MSRAKLGGDLQLKMPKAGIPATCTFRVLVAGFFRLGQNRRSISILDRKPQCSVELEEQGRILGAALPLDEDEADETMDVKQRSREASSLTAYGTVTVHRVCPQNTSESKRKVRIQGGGSTRVSSMSSRGAASSSGTRMRSRERSLPS